ncbi:MAG TPA: hypothetical protein VKB80_08475 [Kofleriaceae bacterium]|nr:hypothetical protein [Kofleriaceae bacterium]
MRARRVLGAALLAGLVGLIAVQVRELPRQQSRGSSDRRFTLRPEADIESLAARSRSDTVRFRYGLWYWLARQLPGTTIRVTHGTEPLLSPLRGVGDIQVLPWNKTTSLELTSSSSRKLLQRATGEFRLPEGRLHVLVDPRADEYVLLTLGGAPYFILPRDQLGRRRR